MKRIVFYLSLLLPCFSLSQAQSDVVNQAQILLQQGQFPEVITLLSPVVKEQSRNAEAYFLLAEAYRQLPKPNIFQANLHIQEAIALQPKNERYWESKVRLLATDDPYFGATISRQERVSEITRELIAQNPNNLLANEIRGIYTFEAIMEGAHAVYPSEKVKQKRNEALLFLKKAIELGSENERTWEALFKMYVQNAGSYSEMVQYWGQARFLFPKRQADWDLYRGVTAYRQQDYTDAAKYLQSYYNETDDSTRALFSDTHYFGEAAKGKTAAQYWRTQDPFQLTGFNERQIEHWARIGYAKLFGYTNTDKGEILIRYGLPLITYTEVESVPIADMEAVGIPNLNLAEDCPKPTSIAGSVLLRYWIFPKVAFALMIDMQKEINNFYAPLASAYCVTSFIGSENAASRESVMRKDSELNHKGIFDATPVQSQLPKTVAFPQQISTFRGQSGNTQVISYAGIPLAKHVKSMNDVPDLLKTGFFFRNANSDSAKVQIIPATTYKNKSKLIALQENTLLIVANEQQLTPDSYQIATEFEVGRIRGAEQQQKTIPSYQGNTFMVSDVMLAYRIEEGTNGGILQRKDLSITPAPWGVFSANQPIYVYLETYNLARQGNAYPYRIEAQLTPKQPDTRRQNTKQGVSVSFAQSPPFPQDEAYFMIETNGQPRGKYTLTLNITNIGTQQTLSKEISITLE